VTRAGTSGNTQGTTFSDTASCPAGKVLLGGGAALTSSSGTYAQSLNRVDLVASYASAAGTWTATALIRSNFVTQSSATVTAYAVCTT
jgi:hypothetical protein